MRSLVKEVVPFKQIVIQIIIIIINDYTNDNKKMVI